MNSKAIATFMGKSILLRKLGYFFISITTLREWYLVRAVDQILCDRPGSFSFLDAGSGMGQHAYRVAKKYPRSRVTGIELDEEQVDDCNHFVQKLGLKNVAFYAGDLTRFNFEESFDLIFCSSVLEHIQDDRRVIEQLHRALKKDGRIIIYVPLSEQRVLPFLARRMQRQLLLEKKKFPHDHVRYYSVTEMSDKLHRAGFSRVQPRIASGAFGRWAYDIVTTVQYNKYFKFLFPVYLLFIHPFVLILMWADFRHHNRTGNGLLIQAQKNGVAVFH